MVSLIRRLRERDEGISMVEGLIVFPLVLLTIVTFVELGFAVFQWNQATKAVNIGARLAAVSDPVATTAAYAALADPVGSVAGSPPAVGASVTCSGVAGAAACDSAKIARLVRGSDGQCSPDIDGGVAGMCDVDRWISPDNVRVTYARAGLGYNGHPNGPVVTATVELEDLTFKFFLVGALLGLDSIPIPAQPVTVTGEDMSSTQ
ncbi:MAG: hypothetical protein RIT14_1239 [Pseudomonadota bacterium]|jgi:hypothetical protein